MNDTLFDAGDNLCRASAVLAHVNIDPEYALEASSPGHGKVRSHSDREGALGCAALLRFGGGHIAGRTLTKTLTWQVDHL